MPRKYAVLRQFAQDFDRLLTEAEAAFSRLKASPAPSQAEIVALFRPIHSLKGICGMLEETKLLVRAFHRLEDVLPPLLPMRATLRGKDASVSPTQWTQLGDGTFRMAREVERIFQAKLDLWKKLGADENESRGLVVEISHAGASEKVWIPVTSLLGIVTASEVVGLDPAQAAGNPDTAEEAILVEVGPATVTVFFEQIHATCTRLDAVQIGVPRSFKEWWTATRKGSGTRAA